jgi:PPOX class probable F420-dependent enzyme
MPHVIPVCYALGDDTLYITIDEKPKRHDIPLKRVRNILENPHAAFEVDRYDDENWTRLGWVMLRGPAEILHDGSEHDAAQALLRARYRQYETMQLAALPVIAVRIARATSWGDLSIDRR